MHRLIVIIAALFVAFCNYGILQTYGSLFTATIEKFAENRRETSLVHSVLAGTSFGAGVIGGYIIKRINLITVSAIGSVLLPVGFIISYWASSVTFLTLSIGLVAGIGISFTYVSAVVVMSSVTPEKHKTTVLSLQNVACGIPGVVVPYLFSWLTSTYGLNGTFLIYGGITLNNIAAMIVFSCLQIKDDKCDAHTLENLNERHDTHDLRTLSNPNDTHYNSDEHTLDNPTYTHDSCDVHTLNNRNDAHDNFDEQHLSNRKDNPDDCDVHNLNNLYDTHDTSDVQTLANPNDMHDNCDVQTLANTNDMHDDCDVQTLANPNDMHVNSDVQTLANPLANPNDMHDICDVQTLANSNDLHDDYAVKTFTNQHDLHANCDVKTLDNPNDLHTNCEVKTLDNPNELHAHCDGKTMDNTNDTHDNCDAHTLDNPNDMHANCDAPILANQNVNRADISEIDINIADSENQIEEARSHSQTMTYILFAIATTLVLATIGGFQIINQDVGVFKGLSAEETVTCIVSYSAASTISRFSPLVFHKFSGNPFITPIVASAFGVLGQVFIRMTSKYSLILIGYAFTGITDGGTSVSVSVVIFKILNKDSQAVGFGLVLTLIGILTTCSGPFFGSLFDQTESYVVVLDVASSIFALGSVLYVCCFILHESCCNRKKRKRITNK